MPLHLALRAAACLCMTLACSCNLESRDEASASPATAPLVSTASLDDAPSGAGASGEARLSGPELDRLLDALEAELAAESRKQ